jgi:hypothetical protein
MAGMLVMAAVRIVVVMGYALGAAVLGVLAHGHRLVIHVVRIGQIATVGRG